MSEKAIAPITTQNDIGRCSSGYGIVAIFGDHDRSKVTCSHNVILAFKNVDTATIPDMIIACCINNPFAFANFHDLNDAGVLAYRPKGIDGFSIDGITILEEPDAI